jgi:hypothetical protein
VSTGAGGVKPLQLCTLWEAPTAPYLVAAVRAAAAPCACLLVAVASALADQGQHRESCLIKHIHNQRHHKHLSGCVNNKECAL